MQKPRITAHRPGIVTQHAVMLAQMSRSHSCHTPKYIVPVGRLFYLNRKSCLMQHIILAGDGLSSIMLCGIFCANPFFCSISIFRVGTVGQGLSSGFCPLTGLPWCPFQGSAFLCSLSRQNGSLSGRKKTPFEEAFAECAAPARCNTFGLEQHQHQNKPSSSFPVCLPKAMFLNSPVHRRRGLPIATSNTRTQHNTSKTHRVLIHRQDHAFKEALKAMLIPQSRRPDSSWGWVKENSSNNF